MAKNRLSNLSNTATGAEIHYRVGAEVDGGVQLLEFFVDIGRNRGIADVGVDLAARSYTDRHRLELRMIDVGGDDHAPGGDFIAHQLRSKLLFARNVFHLFGDHAAAGVVHLREVRVAASSSFCASPPQPLRTQLWHFVAVAGLVSALKVLGAHFVPLDNCVETMRQTGIDMSERYKETSTGGLAVMVLGIPDPERDQVVAAVILAEPDTAPDVDELRADLRTRLSAYKVPRRFLVLAPSHLPMRRRATSRLRAGAPVLLVQPVTLALDHEA